MIQAIVLAIVIHAQTVMPILGSTQGSTAAPVVKYTPLVLRTGTALVLRTGTAFVVTH
jgi:hypothetical protein